MTKQTKADLQQEITLLIETNEGLRKDYLELSNMYGKLNNNYNSLKGKTDMTSQDETVVTRAVKTVDSLNKHIVAEIQDKRWDSPPKAIKFFLLMFVAHVIGFLLFGLTMVALSYPAFGFGVFITADIYCMIRYFNYVNTMDYSNAKTE